MYFSSDSWGKFLNTSNLYREGLPELERLDVDLNKVMFEFLKGDNHKTQREIYRELLEVLKMPVANPTNPGEMDHVDLSLIDKVVIESQYIYNFRDNRKDKVEFSILPHPSREGLLLYRAAIYTQSPYSATHDVDFPVQKLEEILSEIVHGKDVKKLEYHPFFKEKTKFLLDTYIENMKENYKLFALLDEKLAFMNGLGVIYDKKTSQDVGTFENIGLLIPTDISQREVLIHDIFFATRSNEEVAADPERYGYEFYNLDEKLVYSIEPKKSSQVLTAEIGSCHFKMTQMNVSIDMFDETNARLPLIQKAQSTKHMMTDPDRNDPFFQEEFERFKADRMAIIRTTQELQKKEKIMSVFADIEL